MGDIVKIFDYSFKIKKNKDKWTKDDRCSHKKLILNQHGDYVECADCGKQVSAFWVLERFVYIWKDAWRDIKNVRKQLTELSEEKQYLKVLKELDRAWRGKNKMAVFCPHCDKGILPEDGLGNSKCSAIIELQRRKEV